MTVPLAWGDTLHGQHVQPCGGWVVRNERTGEWLLCPPTSEGFYLHFAVHQSVPDGTISLRNYSGQTCTPIFPPPGFAGLTDAELWAAATGHEWGRWYIGPVCIVRPHESADGYVEINRKTEQYGSSSFADLPELILALQNAATLSKRLQLAPQEAEDGR